MVHQASALHYAVRLRVLVKCGGQLCLVVGTLTLVPLAVALGSGEIRLALRYTLVTVSLLGLGFILGRLRAPEDVQVNESLVLTAGIFLVTPLVMTYPFMASGLTFSDALFETISGSTTTGLSTLGTVAGRSPTFLFTRAWMQWYGGLGIVVLSLALIVEPGPSARRLAVTETDSDDIVGGTRAHARRVLVVYVMLTGGAMLALWLLGAAPFEAVVYALAAVSTGGFAPHDASLAGLGAWPVQALVIVICLFGALPFPLFYSLFRRSRRLGFHWLQLQMLLVSGSLVTVVLGMCLWSDPRFSWRQIIHHAPLLAFSAHTTAGFSTLPLSDMNAVTKLVLTIAMAIGGGVGSTAGGFKVLRLLIVMSVIRAVVVRTCLPRHAVFEPRMAGRRLHEGDIREALLLILLMVGVIVLSWLPFLVLGVDPLDALFEVVSATGTVGLSVGISRPELPAMLKAVLCLDMLLGRLEIVAWLVLLNPGTWIGRRRIAS